jgi:hypothetical protein
LTEFQSLGLSITGSDPLWRGTRGYFDLSSHAEAYSHEIAAMGGYKSASITLKVIPAVIDEWLELGLGRHIVVTDTAGDIVWEGFVNQVSANIGTLSVTRGPMMNIANRVLVMYTPIYNMDVSPPVQGVQTETTLAEDSDSQARYSILEKIISGGTLVDDGVINEAEMLRDAYLEEYRLPESSENVNLNSPSQPGLTLQCLGYEAYFDQYVFNDASTGSVQVPTKLVSVLAADPNGVFSTDYDRIADTATYLLLVNSNEYENRTARVVINEMITLGDANNLRTLFGIYANRIAHYSVIPSRVDYQHYISDAAPHLETVGRVQVYPWNVLPGMWVYLPDYLMGRSPIDADFRSDPRYIFAETVTYSSVWGLQINGLRFGKIKQLQAKLGSGVW